MSFNFKRLAVPDVVLAEPIIFSDQRGFFMEVYKKSDYGKWGITKPIVQISHSRSRKNVLRGLHYQLNPGAQGKLIRVIVGKIFDVAVDIRKGSPYYGKWAGEVLNAEEKRLLWIPEGFAHGYCVLSDAAEVIYYCTNEWAPQYERGIRWNDPAINIIWPLQHPILSQKDSIWPSLEQADNNFEIYLESRLEVIKS